MLLKVTSRILAACPTDSWPTRRLRSFRQDVVKIARTIPKPLMIAESTPYKIGVTQGEKSWRIWFERYFDFIKKNNVKMFCYINWNWESIPMFKDQGWGNARLQDDPYIFQKWIEELDAFRKYSIRF